jgi:hypothetical protein
MIRQAHHILSLSKDFMSAEFALPIEAYQPLRETKQLTYDPQFDVDAYRGLQHLRFSEPEEYTKRLEGLQGTTEFNLVTMLGERLNAAVSRRIDLLDEDGVMRDSSQGKPLLEWYEKGRQARLEQGSSPHDQLREHAEIIGQQKIQDTMGKAPIGTLMFFASRPGNEHLLDGAPPEEYSIYGHNFIDMQYKQSDNEIVVMRVMSGLTMDETVENIKLLKPDYEISDDPDDIELLSRPVEIRPGESFVASLEELQQFLYRDLDNSLSEDEFEIVKNECIPYIRRYLMIVENSNYVTDLLKRAYNAIVNKADEVVDAIREGTYFFDHRQGDSIASLAQMAFLGSQPVRAVSTGCGFSGGFAVGSGNNSPFGVLDFSNKPQDESDSKGSLFFPCPSCRHINKRPREGFVEFCQKCSASVRCDEPSEEELQKKRLKKMQEEEKTSKNQEEKKTNKSLEKGILVTLFGPSEERE